MADTYGWMGKILRVNLTRGHYSIEPLDLNNAERFIGGRGLAAKILWDELDPTVDPLSPDNMLIFATGPLTGTGAVTGSRYMVVTKSPLTDAFACSNSGGYFGSALKAAGYDLLIFEGKAPKPVYLLIRDQHIEIRPAGKLWGKTTTETEQIIRADLGNGADSRKTRIAAIGPAGEHLVRMACVVNDSRTASRSGVGAVMGSKNLKAVAINGTGKPKVWDREGLRKARHTFLETFRKTKAKDFDFRSRYGTWRFIPIMLNFRMMPTKNFTAGFMEGLPPIEDIRKKILVKKESCFSCPFQCGRETRLNDPEYGGKGKGPEYESFVQLGPCCGIKDLSAITKANYLCNELGMDTISVGVTIACAMEMFEKGYLPRKDVPFPLPFGDKNAMLSLVNMIAAREGIGDRLAEGSYRFADHYGHPVFSMSVKKQELPAIHPQGYQGGGLAFATSNSGASHTRSGLRFENRLGTKGEAAWMKENQDLVAVIDSSGLCWSIFGSFGMLRGELLTELECVTGAGYTEKSLMEAGERIFNTERLFNLKAGLTAADDTLPRRLMEEPQLDGVAHNQVVRLHEMLPEYYRIRGWDQKGIPSTKKRKELELA